jgi:hypothetical protein
MRNRGGVPILIGMRRHLTYANIVSSICLFILLGGSAYAATKITGKQVRNNSLSGADIRNGTVRAADLQRGLLGTAGQGPRGERGPQGERGLPGEPGAKGDPGAGAIPISLTMPTGQFELEEIEVGPLTVAFNCTNREAMGRPQVQFWTKTDPGGDGFLQFQGIRSHSTDQSFITNGMTEVNTSARTVEGRWAPAGGWAAVGLDVHYRSGARAATVSFSMIADDRDDTCSVAGTAVYGGVG